MEKLKFKIKRLFAKYVYNYDLVLNSGERFDPVLLPMKHWRFVDKCHVPRYEFAKKFIDKNDSVIDIACGTGYGTFMLSEVSKSITGIDLSDNAINYARKNNKGKNIEYCVSDLCKCDKRADIVVSFETIEHIQGLEIGTVLNRLSGLCRKRLIGSVPYKEIFGNNPHHYMFNLYEQSLEPLREYGVLSIYYQDANGDIAINSPRDTQAQNLIFVLDKHQ
jgi:SAM-dependent methyltransferase